MVIRNWVEKKNWESNRRELFFRIERNEEKAPEGFTPLDESY
ncbi:MAG: hypothetical protein ACOC87_04310 [Candidatus Natronoplasma sp.]